MITINEVSKFPVERVIFGADGVQYEYFTDLNNFNGYEISWYQVRENVYSVFVRGSKPIDTEYWKFDISNCDVNLQETISQSYKAHLEEKNKEIRAIEKLVKDKDGKVISKEKVNVIVEGFQFVGTIVIPVELANADKTATVLMKLTKEWLFVVPEKRQTSFFETNGPNKELIIFGYKIQGNFQKYSDFKLTRVSDMMVGPAQNNVGLSGN